VVVTELKAIGLASVGIFLFAMTMSVGLIVAHAPGELLAVAFGVAGVIGALVLASIIKHYQAVNERRKREEILLSR
jgi:hypothetical protein